LAIISLYSGSFCHGEEIAQKVADKLGLERIEEKLLLETARRFNLNRDKLIRTMTGPTPFFNKFTREREKNVASLKVVLADLIREDDKMLFGMSAHLLPETIPHLLKICVIANFEYRAKQAVAQKGIAEKEAERMVRNDDKEQLQWTQFLFDEAPYENKLFDVLIPMQERSIDDAIAEITGHAQSEMLRTTPDSLMAAKDFALAARVNLELVNAGHSVDVTANEGIVTLTINNYVVRLEKYRDELKQAAEKVAGVAGVETRIGAKFSPPPILSMGDVELPKKILLVDDEKEFVHTLSERLETRDISSSIVYDGEEALEYIKRDEPDVMVLDLKMPGIDGIEVLRRVKRDYPHIEVIILTGHGSEREEAMAEQLGAFAYLHKPVNIDVLTQVMKEAYQKVNKLKESMGKGENPS
jgi:two-component system response regulator CpxR